jgi:hypothetical protein
MWPYFNVPLEGHIRQVWLYLILCDKVCDRSVVLAGLTVYKWTIAFSKLKTFQYKQTIYKRKNNNIDFA